MKAFSLLSLLLAIVAGTTPNCEGDGANTVRCFEETLISEVYDQKFQQVDSAEKLTELVKSLLSDRIEKLNNPPANEAAEYAAIHDPKHVAFLKHYYSETIATMLNYYAEYTALRIKIKGFDQTESEILTEAKFEETMKNINTLVEEFKDKIQQILDEQKKKVEVLSASPGPTKIAEPSVISRENGVIEDNANGYESDEDAEKEGNYESDGVKITKSIEGLEDYKCDESLSDILGDIPATPSDDKPLINNEADHY